MDGTRPSRFFCKQAGLQKIRKKLKLYQGVLSVSFSNFTFDFHDFLLKMLKIIQFISEQARGRKSSGEQ